MCRLLVGCLSIHETKRYTNATETMTMMATTKTTTATVMMIGAHTQHFYEKCIIYMYTVYAVCIQILWNRPYSMIEREETNATKFLRSLKLSEKLFLPLGCESVCVCVCRYVFVMISSKIGVAEWVWMEIWRCLGRGPHGIALNATLYYLCVVFFAVAAGCTGIKRTKKWKENRKMRKRAEHV